jgi:hypothetical protein
MMASILPYPKTLFSRTKMTPSLLPRIKAFSARVLKEQKSEWEGGESYLILGSDIMDIERQFRPSKLKLKCMKIDQLPLFLRRSFQKKPAAQFLKPVTPTGESSVMQTLVAFQAFVAEKYARHWFSLMGTANL